MSQFILFVRGGGGSSTDLTPAESEALRSPYAQWAGKLAQEGRLVNADEVDENYFRLTRPNGRVITEGPLAPEPNAIGGYFIFNADSDQHALEIAQACPVLDKGGSVELHRVLN